MLPPQANSAPSHPALPVALQELEVGGGQDMQAGYPLIALAAQWWWGGRRGQTCPVKEQRRGGSRLTLLLHQREEGKTLGPRFQKNS